MQGQAYALGVDPQSAMALAANFGAGVSGADGTVHLDPQSANLGASQCHPPCSVHYPLSLQCLLLLSSCISILSRGQYESNINGQDSNEGLCAQRPTESAHSVDQSICAAAGSGTEAEGQAASYGQGHDPNEAPNASMQGQAQGAMQYFSHEGMQVWRYPSSAKTSCSDCRDLVTVRIKD